jgi:nickel/cobalt exporter
MHEHHKGHSHHSGHHGHESENADVLRKLQVILEHWIEHDDSHVEAFREWAQKASEAGEEEIAREIQLAIGESASVKSHLKRAGAIAAAKLVLRK